MASNNDNSNEEENEIYEEDGDDDDEEENEVIDEEEEEGSETEAIPPADLKPAEDERLGCQHYKRKCKLVAPCCGRAYTCRFCHDDSENHQLVRTEVMEVVCLVCQLTQSVSNLCTSCNTVFGTYFCPKCRLFDDDDKKQFHCDGCGICRVGGQENFYHCYKCGLCLCKSRQEKHKCIENASRSNCPVCLEDIHSSRISAHSPPCGHLLHRTCFDALLKNGNYTCPLCNMSMVNMASVWQHMDEELVATPMPPDYAGLRVGILCRDCHQESKVDFHVVGLKCGLCGSYNTCRTSGGVQPGQAPAGDEEDVNDDEDENVNDDEDENVNDDVASNSRQQST